MRLADGAIGGIGMGEMVDFSTNGGAAEGYLAAAGAGGRGVIVLQEWWRLNAKVKAVADRAELHPQRRTPPRAFLG